MWQGEAVARSDGPRASPARGDGAPHAARGGARRVALDSPRRRGSDPQSALGPARASAAWPRPSRSPTCRAQRAAYERGAALGLSHVLYAKSPGGVVASAPAHGALAARSIDRVASARARPRHARGDRLARVGRARRRARLRRPARGRGPDPDPGRDRPEPAGPARRRQGLRARSRAASSAGAGVRQREALRRRVDERFDPAKALEAHRALPATSPRASSGATTSPSSPTTWASATCSRR